MEEYRLNNQDIQLINRMTISLGGYINIRSGTFNGKIGPKEPMKIVHYGCRYGNCRKVGVEVILEPDMDFNIRKGLIGLVG